MQTFLISFIYLFTSALYVSGFLLAYLQRLAYNFDSCSSLLCMVPAHGLYKQDTCITVKVVRLTRLPLYFPVTFHKLCIKLLTLTFN
jgi:hypothetical protein